MAQRTNLYTHVAAMCRAGFELVTAAAGNVDFWIIWMNFSFHALLSNLSNLSQAAYYELNR